MLFTQLCKNCLQCVSLDTCVNAVCVLHCTRIQELTLLQVMSIGKVLLRRLLLGQM